MYIHYFVYPLFVYPVFCISTILYIHYFVYPLFCISTILYIHYFVYPLFCISTILHIHFLYIEYFVYPVFCISTFYKSKLSVGKKRDWNCKFDAYYYCDNASDNQPPAQMPFDVFPGFTMTPLFHVTLSVYLRLARDIPVTNDVAAVDNHWTRSSAICRDSGTGSSKVSPASIRFLLPSSPVVHAHFLHRPTSH